MTAYVEYKERRIESEREKKKEDLGDAEKYERRSKQIEQH